MRRHLITVALCLVVLSVASFGTRIVSRAAAHDVAYTTDSFRDLVDEAVATPHLYQYQLRYIGTDALTPKPALRVAAFQTTLEKEAFDALVMAADKSTIQPWQWAPRPATIQALSEALKANGDDFFDKVTEGIEAEVVIVTNRGGYHAGVLQLNRKGLEQFVDDLRASVQADDAVGAEITKRIETIYLR
jgi:hypothetical protein